jgi:hypothetical protein
VRCLPSSCSIIAGGASGVAVAWKSGLAGALQSGAFIAIISWLFDVTSVGPAKAASRGCSSCACPVSLGRHVSCSLADGRDARPSTCGAGGAPRLHIVMGAPHRRLLERFSGSGAHGERALLAMSPCVFLGSMVRPSYFAPPAMTIATS